LKATERSFCTYMTISELTICLSVPSTPNFLGEGLPPVIYAHAYLKDCYVAYNPPRTPPRDLLLVRGAVVTSCRFCSNCTGYPCDNESNSSSWSFNVYPAMHWRIWLTTLSSSLTSACADSARPTRRCVLFDGHTTPSAIGVSQRLDHTCGTHYLLRYDNVIVSES